MNIEEVIPGFSAGAWEVAKIGVLIGLTIYLLFSIVVIREVNLMTRTIAGSLDRVIRVVAWGHFALSIAVLLFALVTL